MRRTVVLRPRVIAQLNQGFSRRLTLLSAPAGFGKTTLVSKWIAICERPEPKVRAAWLSLDEEDNDPTRFLTYLVAALQTIVPNIGAGVLETLKSPQPPPTESVVTVLLNEITAVPDNYALVLDDYHVVDAKPVDVSTSVDQAVSDAIGGHFAHADLESLAHCRRVADEVLRKYGAIHILINIAGLQHVAPIDEFPEEMWSRLVSVMLAAPFLLTKHVWPAMKAQGWGRVVNMGSIHSLVASPFKAAYVSAKHGLLGLTRTVALEGGPFGITVNAICPAYVRTPMVEHQIADQAHTREISPDEVIETVMLEPAAIKRLIEPEEVAAAVVYLCSDVAAPITGATWELDLGWTAR